MKKELTLLALACPTLLFGQSQVDSARLLNEVVILSQHGTPSEFTSKVPATKHEVPLSLVVIGPQSLKDRNPINLVEAVRTVPGVRPMRTYGSFQRFYMRGFSDMVVLNDGLRDERHTWYHSAPVTSLASVERVDVLRGANSMAVGHTALGGVINIIHKKPTQDTHANASITYGSWDTYRMEAGTSGSLAKGLTFRADFGTGRTEGWRHTQERFVNGYLNLNYKASAQDELSLVISANDDFYRGDPGRPHMPTDIYSASTGKILYHRGDAPIGGDRRTAYGDPIDHLGHKNLSTLLRWDHQFLNDWTLTNQLSYFYDDVRYFETEDLIYQTPSTATSWYKEEGGQKVYLDLSKVKRDYFQFDYLTKILTEQLELSGQATIGETKHKLLFGYTLGHTSMPRYQGLNLTGAGVGAEVTIENPVINQGNIDAKFTRKHIQSELINSLYAQDFMRYGNLAVLGGVRLDLYNRRYQLAQTADKTITSKGDQYKTNYLSLTYRLGLVYDLTKDWNVYTSISNFFKPNRQIPADNRLYLDASGNEITTAKKDVFAPERAFQFELGTHYRMGQRLQASLAFYHIAKRNIVENLGKTTDGTKDIVGQVGRATSTGLELDLTYNASKWFDFQAGYGLTVAKVSEYSINRYTNTSAGKYLDRVPKHTAFGWGYFNQSCSANSDLRLGLGLEYSSKVYADLANEFEFPTYTLLNAMASYRYKNWRIQLNADNLTDKLYYVTSVNTTGYIPSPGRSFNLSLHYSF